MIGDFRKRPTRPPEEPDAKFLRGGKSFFKTIKNLATYILGGVFMAVLCGAALSNELGTATGGQLGDQTGGEVKTHAWYDFGQTVVYRINDRSKARVFARLIKDACENDNIGYCQDKRLTLYDECVANNFNISGITTPCACDCSSLVACCLIGAGYTEVAPYMTTASMADYLDHNANFTKYTSSAYCNSSDKLLVGDIMNEPGSHTAVVIETDNNTVTKDDVICSNEYLSLSDMTINAEYIYRKLSGTYGWTDEAIAGFLGNIQVESTINPGLWQSLDYENRSLGFGLVQWTPATNLINWCTDNGYDYYDIYVQLARLEYERVNGEQYYQTEAYPISFTEYINSTASVTYLASAWLKNYERAGVEKEEDRQNNAIYWYDIIKSGTWGSGSGGGDTPGGGDITGGSVLAAILKTPYIINQLSTAEIEIIKTLNFGDTVYMKYTFERSKQFVGKNCFGKRLTFDNAPYIIESVRSNGFLVLSNGTMYKKYINPKYVRRAT